VETSEEKRARIIAAQSARDAAEVAAGKRSQPTKRRSNWAASNLRPGPDRFRYRRRHDWTIDSMGDFVILIESPTQVSVYIT